MLCCLFGGILHEKLPEVFIEEALGRIKALSIVRERLQAIAKGLFDLRTCAPAGLIEQI